MQGWFWSSRPLVEIALDLRAALELGPIHSDVENVYEWVEAPLGEAGTTINLSRQHDPDDGDEQDRVTLLLQSDGGSLDDAAMIRIGRAIADTLQVELHIGSIEYLQGDEYDYRAERVLRPLTGPPASRLGRRLQ
ncbi:MAG: hypothetical protein JRI23_22455 [Deltaproteobacteria bacterium]|nr:hypothetical protein [Deltaproteobacteria bacterium]MBW2534709.1 hypothetical protein [Deltaproteobacteria bacterium]